MRANTQQRDGHHSLRRFIPLIPLVMLALAMFACEDNPPPQIPPRAVGVVADAKIAGKAYALVDDTHFLDLYPYPYQQPKDVPHSIYETVNYGESWQRSNLKTLPFPSIPAFKATMIGDNLFVDGKQIWSMPRAIFRSLFYRDRYYFLDYLPPGQLSADSIVSVDVSPAAPDVIYAAMGTEGVLVGPNPGKSGSHPRP